MILSCPSFDLSIGFFWRKGGFASSDGYRSGASPRLAHLILSYRSNDLLSYLGGPAVHDRIPPCQDVTPPTAGCSLAFAKCSPCRSGLLTCDIPPSALPQETCRSLLKLTIV